MKKPSSRPVLTPGSLLAAALAVIVASVCIRLGFWQLDRLETRRATNAAIAQAMAQPDLELDTATLTRIIEHPDMFVHRTAIAEGRFDFRQEVLLRGRSHQGRPGVHVITPLVLASGEPFLVNRGWLPAPDAASVDPRPSRPAGPVRVRGTLQWIPDLEVAETPVTIDLGDAGIDTYRRLDHAERASALGTDLPRLYLQRVSVKTTSGSLPIPVPTPALDEGPHLGYAIQWFSFAAIALIGLAVVAIRSRSSGGRDHFSDRVGRGGTY